MHLVTTHTSPYSYSTASLFNSHNDTILIVFLCHGLTDTNSIFAVFDFDVHLITEKNLSPFWHWPLFNHLTKPFFILNMLCWKSTFLEATFHSGLFVNNLFLTKDDDAVFPFDSFNWFAKTWDGSVRFLLTKRTSFLSSFAVDICGRSGLGRSLY